MLDDVKMVCMSCGAGYSSGKKIWHCKCGGFLELEYGKSLDQEKLKGRSFDYWRYDSLLPIANDEKSVSLGEPCTPLLSMSLGGKALKLKMENLNPNGSFKDRGTAMMINAVIARGIEAVVEDSSGNAGSSVAAFSALAKLPAKILVPASTTEGKVNQIKAFGAELIKIEGDRQKTAEAALVASRDCYYASHCWDPFFIEGVKTIAFEIAEQLGWNAPDSIYLPVGNGSLLLGTYKGFSDLLALGVISQMPVIIGVQGANCNPVVSKWAGVKFESSKAPTLAEGIAVSEPARLEQIISAVKASGGHFLSVTETEIVDALKSAAARGLLMEPTSAVALAAAIKSAPVQNETVVPITGSGLKSVTQIINLL